MADVGGPVDSSDGVSGVGSHLVSAVPKRPEALLKPVVPRKRRRELTRPVKVLIAVGLLIAMALVVRSCVTGGVHLGQVQEPSGDPDAYIDDATGFEIILPDTWASASLLGAKSDLGTRMFPDDPDRADFAQDMFDDTTEHNVFAGTVADRFMVADPVTILVTVEPVLGGMGSYEEMVLAVEDAVLESAATDLDDDTVRFLGGDGVRINFELADDPTFSGRIYGGVVEGRAWRLLVVGPTTELRARAEEIEAIAASFRVIS